MHLMVRVYLCAVFLVCSSVEQMSMLEVQENDTALGEHNPLCKHKDNPSS